MGMLREETKVQLLNIENKEPYGYVYITTNLINNKKYIGQHATQTFDKSYIGSGKILKRAIKKYGKENFKTEVLEWCYNREELGEKEKYWIDFYNATNDKEWYNIIPGGYGVRLFGEDNPMYGKHHTDETKRKLSSMLKGVFSGENNPMYGVHLQVSEETCKKISESHKRILVGEHNPMYGKPAVNRGKPMSEETKRKLSISSKGKKHNIPIKTQENLKKIRSERMTGEKNPMYGKSGINSLNYRKHPSEESKKKMSESHKGKNTGLNNPSSKPIYDINSDIIFGCIREVEEYFGLTYGQARWAIDNHKDINFNGHTYVLTRIKETVTK